MDEAEGLCDKIGILVNGQIACLGSPDYLKNKHTDGYKVTIPYANNIRPPRIFNTLYIYIYIYIYIEDFILNLFPGKAILLDEREGRSEYKVLQEDIPLSNIFEVLYSAYKTGEIQDFSISQFSLEHVFMHFALRQREEEFRTLV